MLQSWKKKRRVTTENDWTWQALGNWYPSTPSSTTLSQHTPTMAKSQHPAGPETHRQNAQLINHKTCNCQCCGKHIVCVAISIYHINSYHTLMIIIWRVYINYLYIIYHYVYDSYIIWIIWVSLESHKKTFKKSKSWADLHLSWCQGCEVGSPGSLQNKWALQQQNCGLRSSALPKLLVTAVYYYCCCWFYGFCGRLFAVCWTRHWWLFEPFLAGLALEWLREDFLINLMISLADSTVTSHDLLWILHSHQVLHKVDILISIWQGLGSVQIQTWLHSISQIFGSVVMWSFMNDVAQMKHGRCLPSNRTDVDDIELVLRKLWAFSTGFLLQIWQGLWRAAISDICHVALHVALRILAGSLDDASVDQDHVDVEQMFGHKTLHWIIGRFEPSFEEVVHLGRKNETNQDK